MSRYISKKFFCSITLKICRTIELKDASFRFCIRINNRMSFMKVMLYYLPLTPKTLTRRDLLYKEKIYEIKLFILKYVILILV